MKKSPAPLSVRVVLAALGAFITLCLVTGGFEIWTLTNNVPNDTISHVVSWATDFWPWLPSVFITLGILFASFWAVVFCHWWKPGFFWKTFWEKTDKSDDEKKL